MDVRREAFISQGLDRIYNHNEFWSIIKQNEPRSIFNIRLHWQQVMSLGFKRCVNLGCHDNAVGFKSPHYNYDINPEIEEKYHLENFVLGSIYKLPFADKEFECSVMGDVLEHLTMPEVALSEMRRVTSKRMVLTMPEKEFDTACAWPGHQNLAEWRFRNILRSQAKSEEEINYYDKMALPQVLEEVKKKAPHDMSLDHVQRFDAAQVKQLLPGAISFFVRSPAWIGFLVYEDLK